MSPFQVHIFIVLSPSLPDIQAFFKTRLVSRFKFVLLNRGPPYTFTNVYLWITYHVSHNIRTVLLSIRRSSYLLRLEPSWRLRGTKESFETMVWWCVTPVPVTIIRHFDLTREETIKGQGRGGCAILVCILYNTAETGRRRYVGRYYSIPSFVGSRYIGSREVGRSSTCNGSGIYRSCVCANLNRSFWSKGTQKEGKRKRCTDLRGDFSLFIDHDPLRI